MTFEFATASRIVFGSGTVGQAVSFAKGLGTQAMIVTGRDPERATPLMDQLHNSGISTSSFRVEGEPTIELVLEGIEQARTTRSEFVIGIGGGSVIDAAKAISALLTNRGALLDYLEVIGQGKPLTERPAPTIAIPTTAGTGAEVTRNAVLASEEHLVKVSLRSPWMLPALAVVDPELTYTMPPSVTASTGLDALTQVVEPFVSHRANPLTDSLCREGMQRAARSLVAAFENGRNIQAREDMCVTSLFGGLALANAALGAAHGFAGPLGGMFPAPHGMICARLLPYVMEMNIRALRKREPGSPALLRYHEVGRILTGLADASAEDGVTWAHTVCRQLEVPPLSSFGVSHKDIPVIVEKSKAASSMKGNPILLTGDELTDILMRAV